MYQTQSRPRGRFFYGWNTQSMVWLLAMALSWTMWLAALLNVEIAHAQNGPATTLVSEVRWSDSGWGASIDRNLVGRFNTRLFTVPRLTRVQNYYLRQYDSSSPAKYSRYSAALHLDFPL